MDAAERFKEVDPDKIGYMRATCESCSRFVRARYGRSLPRFCGSCRRNMRDNDIDRENPNHILALRVTEQRLAIVDAIQALEMDRPAVALARLQTVATYDPSRGPLSAHKKSQVHESGREAGIVRGKNAAGTAQQLKAG